MNQSQIGNEKAFKSTVKVELKASFFVVRTLKGDIKVLKVTLGTPLVLLVDYRKALIR